MVTLAQDGPAAFRDRYELLYRHRAEGPNALWQADHVARCAGTRLPMAQRCGRG